MGGEGHRVAGFHLETHVVDLAFDMQEWAALASCADDVQLHAVCNVLHLQEGRGDGEGTEGQLRDWQRHSEGNMRKMSKMVDK